MLFRVMRDTSRILDAYKPSRALPRSSLTFLVHRLRDDINGLDALLFTTPTPPTPGRLGGPAAAMHDRTFDLAQRYFLERDNAAFGLWLTSMRPSPLSLFDRKLRPADDWAVLLTAELMASRKDWNVTSFAHVRAIQAKVDRVDAGRRICEGGAHLPATRQWVERGFVQQTTEQRYTTHREQPCIPLWPPLCHTTLHSLRPPHGLRRTLGDAISLSGFLVPAAREDAPERGRGPRGRGSRSRTESEPNARALGAACLPTRCGSIGEILAVGLEVVYEKLPPADLFRRTRSRSLSRSSIRDMFTPALTPVESSGQGMDRDNFFLSAQHYCVDSRGKWDFSQGERQPHAYEPVTGYSDPKGTYSPCSNCADTSHPTFRCRARCGFCGAPNPQASELLPCRGLHGNPHMAPQCPVAKRSRCKCVGFPQFHLAHRCPVTCSRDCGSPHPPGTPKHKNAMTCKSRCCMCGLRGHSGRDCRQQVCRCRRRGHLGQDCCWNPVCRVDGCDRYLCGVHCRGCGSREKPFVDWRCRKCEASAGPKGRREA